MRNSSPSTPLYSSPSPGSKERTARKLLPYLATALDENKYIAVKVQTPISAKNSAKKSFLCFFVRRLFVFPSKAVYNVYNLFCIFFLKAK